MIQVTYISHSGFLVETDSAYLLFDYYQGVIPDMKEEKPRYVFASHSHDDHFNKKIFELEKMNKDVTYILSSDIEIKTSENRISIPENVKKQIGLLQVETFRSTDEGVAFLVTIDQKVIFHAGDLHWWHWIGEPEEDNEAMKQMYLSEMKKLERRHIDLAFLVLDPRQEAAFDWGFDYFLKHTDTDIAFPMHFWKDYSVIDAYKYSEKAKEVREKVMDICRERQSFTFS